ncbi:MAG: 4Fe-4S binding protein [Candidatus Helarchaeota archaeon]|nr:4Fe-4S binding protein [Candidatus Helarchaeota archaeon]
MSELKTKLDYYDIVRQKLTLGPLRAPKHEKIFEMMRVFWDEETIKVLSYFPTADKRISLNELVEKSGMEKKTIKKILKKAVTKRTVSKVGQKYGLEPLAPGIFEAYFTAQQDTKENIHKAAEIFRWLFNHMAELDAQGLNIFDKNFQFFRPLLPIEAKEKLIKIDESVDARSQVLPYELVEDLINKNEYFASIPCQCRMIGEMTGEPCELAPSEMGCFITGVAAQAAATLGWGTALNKEQAIEYLKKTEKAGLVHISTDSKGGEHLMFICNCCPCHCGVLMPVKKHGYKSVVPSNYKPKINLDLCVECEICVKKCPMDAISHPEEGKMVVDPTKCIGCGLCASNCAKVAITLEKVENIVPPDVRKIGNKTFMGMMADLLASF